MSVSFFLESLTDEYGGLIQFSKENLNKSTIETIYDDRIRQWDPNKNEALCKKHFGNSGQCWDNRQPKKIETFLSDYLGYQVELLKIIRYPTNYGWYNWRFDYIKK